ncbi:MAG: hypothetical protein CL843_14985 [Crocinitomicaceae bacterium]|nr:hypothetical protein [Crocinitomicaceae bacterium]|tara:strand:+ start:799 stop:1260 length:462 start_codon:yes stop_codon:yes gene_type:complete
MKKLLQSPYVFALIFGIVYAISFILFEENHGYYYVTNYITLPLYIQISLLVGTPIIFAQILPLIIYTKRKTPKTYHIALSGYTSFLALFLSVFVYAAFIRHGKPKKILQPEIFFFLLIILACTFITGWLIKIAFQHNEKHPHLIDDQFMDAEN